MDRRRRIPGTLPNPLYALPFLLLALGLLSGAKDRITGDTWFDLVAGRDIVQHGLPHHDRLMAMTAGRPWQDQQWLAQIGAYGLYVLGGLPLVAFVDCGLLLLSLVLAMLAARSLGGSPMWITAVSAPVMLVLGLSPSRAQSVAMPLFSLLVWLLARDARRHDRRIALVAPLLVLWANVHGSVLLASGLVLLYAAFQAGAAVRARAARDLGRPLALAAVAAVAPFASPYGLGLVSYYRSTAANGSFARFIAEWAGTTLQSWPTFYLFVALVLVALVRPEVRLGPFESACLALLVLVGLDAARNVVWLPLAAVVLLPAGLAHWSPEPPLRLPLRRLCGGLALAGCLGVVVLATRVTTPALASQWPTAQGAAVAEAASAHPSMRIVSDAGYADWLLFRYPFLQRRIAFDVRFELLGARGMASLVHLETAAGPSWQRPVRGYRLALWSKTANPELVAALRAEPGSRVLSHADGVYAIQLASAPA